MITVAIPTYNRGEILLETIERLRGLSHPAAEILIVDQTRSHPPEITDRLAKLDRYGAIRWLRLPEPSIPLAMNRALLKAEGDVVLFLDDDIQPDDAIVTAHRDAHRDAAVWAVAGQVLQPGEQPQHHRRPPNDLDFRFNHDEACDVANVMAGNLSVKRQTALAVGGFDENYIGAAYRFESDFAFRVLAAGGRIRFEPRATIKHLQLATGGIRSYGDHRSDASPLHAVGDYYFGLRHLRPFLPYALRRLAKNILTRYHVRRPWKIPSKLAGELRALMLARRLAGEGPRLLHTGAGEYHRGMPSS